MLKRISIILLACVLLSSCGFHLRGKYEYADALNPIVILSDDRDFIYELEEVFDFSGLQVVETPSSANAILEFTNEVYSRVPVSLDSRGQATRYRLNYKSRYRVLNRAGDSLLRTGSTTATRTMDYDPALVLQQDIEEQFLKEEMYQDMAQAVARRLSRVTGEVVLSAESVEEYEKQIGEETDQDD